MLMFFYFSTFFLCGLWVFCMDRKHLLITLLSLEFMVLSLFVLMYYYLCGFNYEFYFVIVFLVFSVCEGSLGLSILVSMIRSYGNDYYRSFGMLQC
ncbi:NADH dehydrogenase subunit 4L (mitochondrion) [Zootermopsis nevadensis]|uniref:NADH-ubiquinone oxidoreductase chain 4L n=1 Tax=Zootermopsis nevadensis TaxID=136037 RepID=A0A0U1WNR6_ZOONE|nr:NADH dehydrogenase subunit 4L [Zootermopsis nevadensis]AIG24360.1 NADH dehydrogenase subunit 4L [Zootermopsis nevadensis]